MTDLKRRVERLIAKADKQGYEFSYLELSVFAALGRAEWEEEKAHWVVLRMFESMYDRFYPQKLT